MNLNCRLSSNFFGVLFLCELKTLLSNASFCPVKGTFRLLPLGYLKNLVMLVLIYYVYSIVVGLSSDLLNYYSICYIMTAICFFPFLIAINYNILPDLKRESRRWAEAWLIEEPCYFNCNWLNVNYFMSFT